MSPPPSSLIDPNSGFCPTNSTFYTKRPPISLPPNPVLDLTTFISARGHLHHNATAFVDATTGHKLKYSQLWQAVDSVSSALSSPSIGVRKGHVILILSPNSIYFPVVCLSAMSLGAIITTTNPLNTSAEIAKQAADSNPFLAFTTPELLPKLAGSNFPIILITDGDHKITVHISSSSQSGSKILTTLEELMATKPSESRIRDRVTQNDTASLLYSSGTTGATKGVISSHANLIAMVEIVIQRFKPRQDSNHHHQQQQVFICTVPMFHIYGMAAFATGLLATGAMIVVLPKFEINDLFTAIERYKVTHFPLVPPIFVAMVNQARGVKKRYDLSTLRVILCGGAPLGKEVIEGFVKEYPGVEISQGYGLTESAAMGTSTNCLEENRRYGTAGLLNPNMEGKIVDPESGRACGVKETGELWIRGPTIMKGYFQNPEATAATITPDGWLKTGDICYIDEDGFLFVVDRLKELIKYKGYQVPPAELEALLLTHPHIDDAAVIPYPDKDVGQFPMAYVVRKPKSSLSEDSVMEFVAKQVAPYKRIRRVAFTNSIPKNPSGKTLRKDLIKMATSTARL